MDLAENIHEPLAQYRDVFAEAHRQNVSAYFENLVKKSGVDEAANQETVKAIVKQETAIAQENKVKRRWTTLKVFLILLIIAAFGAAIYFFYETSSLTNGLSQGLDILFGILALCLAIGLILIAALKVQKEIKASAKRLAALETKKNQLIATANVQLAPLNDLYDWSMTAALVRQTTPLIQLDPYFDIQRYQTLHEHFGLGDNGDQTESILAVQSGQIIGNPFVLARKLKFHMGTKSYTGTLVIHWTVTVYRNNHWETESRSQTLTATLVEPYPEYASSTFVAYGNDAAPNLCFSRTPSKATDMSDKAIERMVHHEEKKIQKKAQKSIANGGSFTALGNDTFDVLFHALDRTDELEFRLLFTPLAQREIIALIKDGEIGYGDDWHFSKYHKMNYVYPQHLASLDLTSAPTHYIHYNLAVSRKAFNDYNNEYFRSLYFAMAPLLAIPLYQQVKTPETIYGSLISSIACWEHEATVNNMDLSRFKHPASVTQNILKTQVMGSADGTDHVRVVAYGFRSVPRVTYVSVLGGDGRSHDVPVAWNEYLPVDQATEVTMKAVSDSTRPALLKAQKDGSWQQFLSALPSGGDGTVFRRTIIAALSDHPFTETQQKQLSAIFQPAKETEKAIIKKEE